jgi:hypothetical protein
MFFSRPLLAGEHHLLAILSNAVVGHEGPRKMQFDGVLGGKPMLILIDSGSTSSSLNGWPSGYA